jgi:hypothetical protein
MQALAGSGLAAPGGGASAHCKRGRGLSVARQAPRAGPGRPPGRLWHPPLRGSGAPSVVATVTAASPRWPSTMPVAAGPIRATRSLSRVV